MIFTDITLTIEKIVFLILLISCGVFARHFKLISDKGQKDLSKLLIDFFWPAMIFSSITQTLNADDILSNIWLPLFAIVTTLVGLLIGIVINKLNKYSGATADMFIYHAMINNFVFMAIPFVAAMFPEKGVGYLFIHNMGMIFIIWVLGVPILAKSFSLKQSLKNLRTPGLIVTVLSIIMVLTGTNSYIPVIINDTVETIGKPAMIVSMLVVGSQIYKMGKSALKFNLWNIQVGFVRLILIPFLLFGLAIILKKYTSIPNETLTVFAIVNCMPASLNSVSMAIRYNSSPELGTQGVVFTHLFSVITIIINILLIRLYIFS